MANESDALRAADALQRLLIVVERGEIEADAPQARRLLRRLEGATSALAALTSGRRRPLSDAVDVLSSTDSPADPIRRRSPPSSSSPGCEPSASC